MVTVVPIVVLCSVFAYFELRSLRRSGLKRESWAFSMLMLAAAAFSIALSLQAPIPSPLEVIFGLFGPVADWADALQTALDTKATSAR